MEIEVNRAKSEGENLEAYLQQENKSIGRPDLNPRNGLGAKGLQGPREFPNLPTARRGRIAIAQYPAKDIAQSRLTLYHRQ